MHEPGVAEDGAALHVRRARRLLRPRARRRPRSRPTTSRRGVDPAPGAPAAWNSYGLRVPAFVISPFAQAQLRVARGARPHVGAAVHRDEVQPRRADPPRRQRVEPARLLRLPARAAFLEPPALAAPGLPATGSSCTPEIPPPPTQPVAAVAASAPISGLGTSERGARDLRYEPAEGRPRRSARRVPAPTRRNRRLTA